MRMAGLSPVPEATRTIRSFGGFEPRENRSPDSFSEMCDLTSDCFPLMAVRKKRLRWNVSGTESLNGGRGYYNGGVRTVYSDRINSVATVNDRGVFCTNTNVYIEGMQNIDAILEDITPLSHKIAVFGKCFMVYPDGLLFEPEGNGYRVQYVSFKKTYSDVLVRITDLSHQLFRFTDWGEVLPQSPTENMGFVLTDSFGMKGYVFSGGQWSEAVDLLIELSAPGLYRQRYEGEPICINGITGQRGKCRVVTVAPGKLYLSLEASPDTPLLESLGQLVYTSLTLSRNMPKMDFMCEHNNRLWGCRYGLNSKGEQVNEIYASALGKPGEWDVFKGISTDSFACSIGCGGEFTGMCTLGGEVLAFKEEHIISVSGSHPSEFTVKAFPARGVKKSAPQSLTVLNEKAFYVSSSGVAVFDGTLPYIISDSLGDLDFTCKCAAGYKDKYCLCVKSPQGESSILVFDERKGVWHRESDRENTVFFLKAEGQLFGVCEETIVEGGSKNRYSFWNMYPDGSEAFDIFRLTPVSGGEYTYIEEALDNWYAVMEPVGFSHGGTSIVRALNFRLSLGENAGFSVAVRCNGENSFKSICSITNPRKGLFSYRVSTPRCDSFALRLSGWGNCVVNEIRIVTEKTSEVTAHG